jgi:hypothetical protein
MHLQDFFERITKQNRKNKVDLEEDEETQKKIQSPQSEEKTKGGEIRHKRGGTQEDPKQSYSPDGAASKKPT